MFYCWKVHLEHADGCLRGPDESAAEKRARGTDLHVPKELLEIAKSMKLAGISTSAP
jgi:hypothetical protein